MWMQIVNVINDLQNSSNGRQRVKCRANSTVHYLTEWNGNSPRANGICLILHTMWVYFRKKAGDHWPRFASLMPKPFPHIRLLLLVVLRRCSVHQIWFVFVLYRALGLWVSWREWMCRRTVRVCVCVCVACLSFTFYICCYALISWFPEVPFN